MKWHLIMKWILTVTIVLFLGGTVSADEEVLNTAETTQLTGDSARMKTAFDQATQNLADLQYKFKSQNDVLEALDKAQHQLDDHTNQLEGGFLTVEQAAYQYVSDYVFLIHEIRLLTMFESSESWKATLQHEEENLQDNMHKFQGLGSPFSLDQMITMADYDLIGRALSEEEVVKASSVSLSAHDEESLIDMRGTWFAVIATVTVLVVITLIELHTSIMSTTFRRTVRLIHQAQSKA